MRDENVGAGGRGPGAGQIDSFRDLRVWTAGMDLVEDIYRVTQPFPASEIYGLTNQMRRAAVSIPANIAEGHTREHSREYLQHLSIAQGSLAELETHVELAQRLGFLPRDDAGSLMGKVGSLGRQLYRLRDAVAKQSIPAPGPRPPAPARSA